MPAPMMPCVARPDGRCDTHGGRMRGGHCQTVEVLWDVRQRRAEQYAQYGTNEDLRDGTGPCVTWLGLVAPERTAGNVETLFRLEYEQYESVHGAPTWMHLVREEVAEAFMESDPEKLREELLDVAALAVSWIEKLDLRSAAKEVL